MKQQGLALFLLRGGIAFSFLYAAIQSFREPASWVGFLPVWLQDVASPFATPEMLLSGFAVFEIALAAWLLWGRYGFYSGLLAAAAIGGIIVTNIGAFAVLFRDVPIFFAALAYAFFSGRGNQE